MNDMDHGIAEIRATARALHRQTEELERRAMEYASEYSFVNPHYMHHCRFWDNRLQAKARECVSRGQRTSAMRYLQQKKQTESIAQKRLGSLQTIDSIIMRLQSAESDAEVGAWRARHCPAWIFYVDNFVAGTRRVSDRDQPDIDGFEGHLCRVG